jgi:hypothetical protein
VLEAKYIRASDRSPWVRSSTIPDAIREFFNAAIRNEFHRYSAVIGDPTNPLQGLEVITNTELSRSFFEDLLTRFNIPGRVVVRQFGADAE